MISINTTRSTKFQLYQHLIYSSHKEIQFFNTYGPMTNMLNQLGFIQTTILVQSTYQTAFFNIKKKNK